MVVLQVNKFFFEKGGAERYFFSLSRALEARGHRVVHFSMQHPANLPSPFSHYFVREKKYHDAGVSWERIPAGISFVRSREAAIRIRALIEETRPQVAHLHNIYHQITPSIIPTLRRFGIPILMTLHDYKLICPNYTLYDGTSYCYRCEGARFFRAPVTRCHERSVLRSGLLAVEAYWQRMSGVYDGVRFFLAPSRYMRSMHVRAGFGENRVVHLPSFVPSEDERGERRAGGGPPESLPPKYVLYFGRLSEEKGLFTLLEVMRRLDDIPLVVCGEGPQEGRLRAYVQANGMKNVHFTGYLAKSQLDRVIEAAHFTVLPSIWPENAPYAVLESVACGTPVVVSDMGGLPELVGKVGGRVFRHGDPEDLARVVSDLWRNDAAAREMGEAGRRAVAVHFSETEHLRRIEEIYQRAMEA